LAQAFLVSSRLVVAGLRTIPFSRHGVGACASTLL